MKTAILFLALMFGQQPHRDKLVDGNWIKQQVAHRDALHCGPYAEIVEFWPEQTCDPSLVECQQSPYYWMYRCVDQKRTVTERDWQTLMDRLKALEDRLKALEDKTAFTDTLREQQCPSLSWVNGKCMPFCDDSHTVTSDGCAGRPTLIVPMNIGTYGWQYITPVMEER